MREGLEAMEKHRNELNEKNANETDYEETSNWLQS